MKIFCGTSNQSFSKKLSKYFNNSCFGKINISKFADGEININIGESVRKETCFVIQPTCKSEYGSVNDSIMELLIIIDALKRGSASSVTAVIPYFGYERQDRKDYSRAPISAAVIARCLESVNVDRVIVFDLHAGQIAGFFSNTCPIDNLFIEPYFIQYIKEKILNDVINISNIVIVSPDEGAVKQATRVASRLGCSAATICKNRKKANIVDSMQLMGDVSNKYAIILDDMIDTGGTACKACDVLIENGALKVYMMASHGLFSGNSYEKINKSNFEKIIVSNTVYIDKILKDCPKIEIINVAWLCSEAIKRQVKGESLNELYDSNDYTNYNFE